MQKEALLRNISIFLVNTKTPGNIGAVARCMMNAGLSRLILVRPPQDRTGEAQKLAAGAEHIIERAEVYPSLKEAVADHGLVVGTSRHTGRHRKNVRTPREMAERVIPLLAKNRVALVFGREVNGLDRNDLSLCHELIWIPSSDAFPSLNLSHAVMVIAYELFLAATSPATPSERELAPAGEIEKFYRHLQETLMDIGFIGEGNKEHMMFSLRQIFGRAQLDRRDICILRGILAEIRRKHAEE
jgi:TrmH family RNA methyltransferase